MLFEQRDTALMSLFVVTLSHVEINHWYIDPINIYKFIILSQLRLTFNI